MKRLLPFIIILLVALITAGAATYFYRSKLEASAKTAAIAAAAIPAPTPKQGNAPDSLHARGPAKASVTLEIYGDFQCPSCANTTGVVDDEGTDDLPAGADAVVTTMTAAAQP